MRYVVDHGVGTREEQPLVPVVVPTHEVGRPPSLSSDLEDLRIPVGLAHMVRLDHQSITNSRVHVSVPSSRFAFRRQRTIRGGERTGSKVIYVHHRSKR